MKQVVIISIILGILLFLFVYSTRAKRGTFDYNCDDFDTQQQAQQIFERYPTDVYKLDGDHDDIACESLPKAR